jgi:hypothetical protein
MDRRTGGVDDEGSKRAQAVPVPGLCSHLLTDALVAVSELNGQVLDALALSAQSTYTFPLGPKLRARFAVMSAAQRQRARHCGVLLADAGFANVDRWRSLAMRGEFEGHPAEREWLPPDDAVVFASTVLLVAWHIVHVRPTVAGFLLGMPESTVNAYRQLGVAELTRIAKRHPQWVRPRWPDRPDLWHSIIEFEADSPAHDAATIVLQCLKANAAVSSRLLASVDSTV